MYPAPPVTSIFTKNRCPFVNSFGTLEVYYNRAWREGQEVSGQKTPRASDSLPKIELQFLDPAGMQYFRLAILKRGQRTGC
jgi:hypothetical protein